MGHWLYQEKDKVKADLVIIGQALGGGFYPVTGVVGTKEIFSVIKAGTHGSTYGGNPMACVAAMETLKVIEEDKMVQNSKDQGKKLLKEVERIRKGNKLIKEVKGVGLLVNIVVPER